MAQITLELSQEVLDEVLTQADNYGHDVPDNDPVSFLENHLKSELSNSNSVSALLDYMLDY